MPYHHPVTLAKRLATIDVLSKGRMRLLTVGLGSLAGEAPAVGVDFATRGRRTDEAIDVLRLLWSGGPDGVSYSGEFFEFENLTSYPHPLAPLPSTSAVQAAPPPAEPASAATATSRAATSHPPNA